ncbi:MAG: peptide chain release factor 2 [Candidatus Sumerlaeia bacterium]|nr:peptide chain release factor 2 [Candidatus Sumerlaeia bacterium]
MSSGHAPATGGIFNYDALKSEIEALEAQSQAPNFWDDAEHAQTIMKKITMLKMRVEPWEKLEHDISENLEMAGLLKEEGMTEGEDAEVIDAATQEIRERLEKLELQSMLTAEEDQLPCFLKVHSGAGGTESQDWTEMLFRMYSRWCERNGYKADILDYAEGEQAGIQGATLRIEGPYAYGFLKGETGIHRLVRISPYDANARRHTSFASVDVTPEIDDTIEVDIGVQDKDWRLDSFRSSGKGGQKVNKTTSAVRITHHPSGIVVSMQNERSWHQNRELAFQVLRSRLYEMELQKRRDKAQERESEKKDIDFGSQLRSYVLHPYKMVNDHRMEMKITDAEAVLDGEIDPFIEGYLRWNLGRDTKGS